MAELNEHTITAHCLAICERVENGDGDKAEEYFYSSLVYFQKLGGGNAYAVNEFVKVLKSTGLLSTLSAASCQDVTSGANGAKPNRAQASWIISAIERFIAANVDDDGKPLPTITVESLQAFVQNLRRRFEK